MKRYLCLAAFAACLAGPAQAVEIQVGYAYGSIFDETMRQIVEGFSAAHPDVEITFRASYENYEDATNTVLREAVADTLPDVSFQGLNRQAVLVEREIARPLDPFIAQETDFDADGYHRAMLKLSTFDGGIYGLPFSVSTPIGYYNMDMLEAAGVEGRPETWDEVAEACRKIVANGQDAAFLHWDITGNWLLQAALWSQGVPTIRDGRLNMDNPQGVAALESIRTVVRDCRMKNVSGGDALKSFAAGELAMMFTTTAYVATVDGTRVGDWAFVTGPYPGIGGAPKALPAGGNAAMLTSTSQDPEVLEAAWQFIKYATSGEGAAVVARTTGYIPPNKVANEVLLADFYARNPNKETAVKQLPLLAEWFAYPGDNGLAATRMIEDYLEEIVVGGADDMPGLRDDMVADVNDLLN